MSVRAASVLTVRRRGNRRYTMNLMRWRPITLHLGAEVAKPSRRIARCGVGSVIGERVTRNLVLGGKMDEKNFYRQFQ